MQLPAPPDQTSSNPPTTTTPSMRHSHQTRILQMPTQEIWMGNRPNKQYSLAIGSLDNAMTQQTNTKNYQ